MIPKCSQLRSVTLCWALTATAAVLLPSTATADEAKPEAPAEQPKASAEDAAPTFYFEYSKLIAAAGGRLPVEQGLEFVGSSLMPVGGRARAIEEAQAAALKSNYKVFVLTYDRQERQTNAFVSGIAQVIKMRAVVFLEKTPDNVMKVLETGIGKPAMGMVYEALGRPEFASLMPKLKEMVVKTDRNATRSGFSMEQIVRAMVQQDGKSLTDDLKKWAKYHSSAGVRSESYKSLIQLGEVAFVEETLKAEQDKNVRSSIDEQVRKARLGA